MNRNELQSEINKLLEKLPDEESLTDEASAKYVLRTLYASLYVQGFNDTVGNIL